MYRDINDILNYLDTHSSSGQIKLALRSTVRSLSAIAKIISEGHVSTIAPDGLADVREILGIEE